MEKDRPLYGIDNSSRHKWNTNQKVNDNEMPPKLNIYGNRAIFPFHTALQMDDEQSKSEHIRSLQTNCMELHRLANL